MKLILLQFYIFITIIFLHSISFCNDENKQSVKSQTQFHDFPLFHQKLYLSKPNFSELLDNLNLESDRENETTTAHLIPSKKHKISKKNKITQQSSTNPYQETIHVNCSKLEGISLKQCALLTYAIIYLEHYQSEMERLNIYARLGMKNYANKNKRYTPSDLAFPTSLLEPDNYWLLLEFSLNSCYSTKLIFYGDVLNEYWSQQSSIIQSLINGAKLLIRVLQKQKSELIGDPPKHFFNYNPKSKIGLKNDLENFIKTPLFQNRILNIHNLTDFNIMEADLGIDKWETNYVNYSWVKVFLVQQCNFLPAISYIYGARVLSSLKSVYFGFKFFDHRIFKLTSNIFSQLQNVISFLPKEISSMLISFATPDGTWLVPAGKNYLNDQTSSNSLPDFKFDIAPAATSNDKSQNLLNNSSHDESFLIQEIEI